MKYQQALPLGLCRSPAVGVRDSADGPRDVRPTLRPSSWTPTSPLRRPTFNPWRKVVGTDRFPSGIGCPSGGVVLSGVGRSGHGARTCPVSRSETVEDVSLLVVVCVCPPVPQCVCHSSHYPVAPTREVSTADSDVLSQWALVPANQVFQGRTPRPSEVLPGRSHTYDTETRARAHPRLPLQSVPPGLSTRAEGLEQGVDPRRDLPVTVTSSTLFVRPTGSLPTRSRARGVPGEFLRPAQLRGEQG